MIITPTMPDQSPFLFIRNSAFAILFGLIISAIPFYFQSIHFPVLVNMLLSFLLGVLAPKKGWLLAIVQGVTVIFSYFIITEFSIIKAVRPDLAQFTTFLAFPIAFTGSYIGSFLKRAL